MSGRQKNHPQHPNGHYLPAEVDQEQVSWGQREGVPKEDWSKGGGDEGLKGETL